MIRSRIYFTLSGLLHLLSVAIFVYALLTWIAPNSALCRWLERLIRPICAPFRRLGRYVCLRWGSPFDLTCVFAIAALELAESLLRFVLFRLF